jgi:hypothetical protein
VVAATSPTPRRPWWQRDAGIRQKLLRIIAAIQVYCEGATAQYQRDIRVWRARPPRLDLLVSGHRGLKIFP